MNRYVTPTILVRTKVAEGETPHECRINESDFDEKVHEKVVKRPKMNKPADDPKKGADGAK